ncbi:NfeD family protein [Kistimonas scapharcae]|uniref:NfeD family protein n=1 Tax=Kistimonas scapharcae TaxID=1036133 RepID=A0ABP8UYI5_9GAMM
MGLLDSLQPWHWLILSLVLFALEALGASGFLIGAGIASALMALLLWLFPSLDWGVQLMLFGVGTLAMTVAWWKVFRRYNEQTDHPELNNRAVQMVGRVIVLEQPVSNGQGRIQIGDTFWKVRSEADLEAGTTVVVSGYDGMVLQLTPRE